MLPQGTQHCWGPCWLQPPLTVPSVLGQPGHPSAAGRGVAAAAEAGGEPAPLPQLSRGKSHSPCHPGQEADSGQWTIVVAGRCTLGVGGRGGLGRCGSSVGTLPASACPHFCCDQGWVWLEGTASLVGGGGDSISVPSAGTRAPRWPPGSQPRGGGGRHRCHGAGRSWSSVSATPPGWGHRGHAPPCTPVPLPKCSRVSWSCSTVGTRSWWSHGPLSAQPRAGLAGLELGPSASHPASLSSAAASESEPSPAGPRAPPALRKHLGKPPGAVTFRGQFTGGCWWRSVLGLKVATFTLGTLAMLTLGFGRDTVPGGDTTCHLSTPRRAGHLGLSPVSWGQDGIR